MSLTENQKICCRAVGREKREMSVLTLVWFFFLMLLEKVSFTVNLFREKAGLLL